MRERNTETEHDKVIEIREAIVDRMLELVRPRMVNGLSAQPINEDDDTATELESLANAYNALKEGE